MALVINTEVVGRLVKGHFDCTFFKVSLEVTFVLILKAAAYIIIIIVVTFAAKVASVAIPMVA